MGHTLGRVMREVFEEVKAAREKKLKAAEGKKLTPAEYEELLDWLRAVDKALTFIAKYAVGEEIAEKEKAAASAAQ